MKIAILIGPKHNKYESTWNDTIPMDPSKRPWLQKVPIIDRRTEGGQLSKTGKWVRVDEANAYAFKHYCSHDVTIVRISQTSYNKLNKYDFVVWHWVDMLVEPRIKKFEKSGVPMKRLSEMYDKLGDKMYPPLDWANTIYDKCTYYSYLSTNGLPIGETRCLEKEAFIKKPLKSIQELKKTFTWKGATFAKPASGTDSLDIGLPSQLDTVARMKKYIKNTFKNPNYSKIVFQKYYSDFEKTVPQIRTYWVGNSFKYGILNDSDGKAEVVRPQMATKGKNAKFFRIVLKIAKRTLKQIKRDFFGKMPLLLTRIDFACCLKEGKYDQLFINEIEFNPGLYLYKLGEKRGKYTKDRPLFEVVLAKQMCKAAGVFSKLKK